MIVWAEYYCYATWANRRGGVQRCRKGNGIVTVQWAPPPPIQSTVHMGERICYQSCLATNNARAVPVYLLEIAFIPRIFGYLALYVYSFFLF